MLFEDTLAQLDVFPIVNCPVVALSVFYSTVLMHSLIFCSCVLHWRSTECVLPRPPRKPWFYSSVM